MARGRQAPPSKGRFTRSKATNIPDSVYSDLAKDVAASGISTQDDRPLKRRRVNGPASTAQERSPKVHPPSSQLPAETPPAAPPQPGEQTFLDRLDGNFSSTPDQSEDEEDPTGSQKQEQVVYDDTDSEDESDIDWVDILGDGERKDENKRSPEQQHDQTLHLDLDDDAADKAARRARNHRLPATVVEKRKRLDIHKVHLCALLAHVYIRNEWCNDHRVQDILSRFLDKRTRGFLNPTPSLSQRDRTTQFIKGLEEASHAWRGKFVVTMRGMRKPDWPLDQRQLDFMIKQAEGLATDRADFLRASAKPAGSRDVAAQLFCALLRASGVDARLVCSLQLLSFTSVAPVMTPSSVLQKPTVDLSMSALDYASDASTTSARSTSPTPKPIRRFGRRARGTSPRPDMGKAPATSKQVRGKDSSYPVFWVEAFNHAKQQWVPVDPFATRTVNRPAKLEPPASDQLNQMTYVMAFNEDGTARDVTRRYTKAYNAKTRRNRVEASPDGDRWLRKVMKVFRSPFGRPDRDAIEDGELDGYEAKEPMPRNVQDFKNHPYYALERHLKRHEVIQPRREVGKLRTGQGENVEPVFRKRDVKLCQTADKWYRSGRELKEGEQPLKRVKARRKLRRDLDDDEEEPEEEADGTVGMFAHEQTVLYKPPACDFGQVPKNAFKNLDVYTSSMIPPGGAHIRSSDAVAACRILRIDYAEAVTGFMFKGRKGTAVVKGAVVAKEYREAIEEVVEALRWQRAESDQLKRSRMALDMWKRFALGLRIRERIMGGQDGDANYKPNEPERSTHGSESGSEYAASQPDDAGDNEGGFVAADGPVAKPTRGADRDIVKEKFQHNHAEDINEDIFKNAKEYWEPTVTSPWDIPGLLEPVSTDSLAENEEAANPDVDALFEDKPGEDAQASGRSLEVPAAETEAESMPARNATSQNTAEPGGFLIDEEENQNPRLAGPEDPDGAGGPDSAPLKTSKAQTAHEDSSGKADEKTIAAEESDELDNQSLLSHDPDDDDAEPDWLDDEVGL